MQQPEEPFFDRALPAGHGLYYVLTGIWPILSSGSFQQITGPKADVWLVKTAGALIATVGGVLLLAGARGRPPREVEALAVGSAASLAGSDLIYAGKQRISRVYFLEAAAELALIALWGWRRARAGKRSRL